MEFQFNVNEYFKRPIVEIGNTLLPPDFVGDRRALWNTVNKVAEIVNEMGEASAHAQGLSKPITTAERLRQSDQNLYLLIDHGANNGYGAVTGMLKIGKKGLYVFDREGQHYQVTPPCVLDFYVHEKRQRSGLGRKLFEFMLEKENVKPHNLAIDRPSDKFLNFLNKHYYLQDPIKQMNNYVVFDGFFPESQRKDNVEISPMNRTNGLQSTQSPNNQPLYGRYGAPRPPCSMGQIIHNTTAQKNSEPASSNNSKKSHDFNSNEISSQVRTGNHISNYTEMQQPNYIMEQQGNIRSQYQYQDGGHNVLQDSRENFNVSQQANHQNTPQFDQINKQHDTQIQQFDQQQNQIRMFPEKENISKNLPYSENGGVQAAQTIGNIWPGQHQPQHVYQVDRTATCNSFGLQDQQKYPNIISIQQYNEPFGRNEQVGAQTVNPTNENSNNINIQQPNTLQHYQIDNGKILQQNTSQNYHFMNNVSQQHTNEQNSQSVQYTDLQQKVQKQEANEPLSQKMENQWQKGKCAYSTAYHSIPQSDSINQQILERTAPPRYPTTNLNTSQQELAHLQPTPQLHQRLPQFYNQTPMEHNSQAIESPHDSYQTRFPEQYPRLMNNQQIYLPPSSVPNITQHVNQQLPVQTTYSSQQFPSYQKQSRTESQEYQYVQPQTRNQPVQQYQKQKQNEKNELKSETVHSLLQVDPKYFKPDPIQLKQSSNSMTGCPTPRNKKEETVASLLNAEQEFFENGMLRDEYRAPARLPFHERISPQSQEQDCYPREIQVTQRAPKQYIPHTPLLVQSPNQCLHPNNLLPQNSIQQEAYRENNNQVEQQRRHSEYQKQSQDQPRSQQNLAPANNYTVEQPSYSEHVGNQQQLHDQSRSQHHLYPMNSHQQEVTPYQYQLSTSDSPDHINPTQRTITKKPQFPQSQHDMIPQNQYREHQLNPTEPNAFQRQDNHVDEQPGSTTKAPERHSGDRQSHETERNSETSPLPYNERQPQQYHANAPSNLQHKDMEVKNTRQCHNEVSEQRPIYEKPADPAECQKEICSPATIRQGSYIANDFNPHPEGPKLSTNTKTKSSDEEIGSRRKNISRQYGLNEVDMRKKSYKSALIKRTTDLQEIDNLEFGYPPQLSKNVTTPTVVSDSVHSSPKLERPKSLEIQTDISVQEPQIQPEVPTVDEEEGLQDDLEPELEKLTMNEDLAPPMDSSDKESGKKTPRHLTEQGYFDLKFYHNKLW